MLKCNFQSSDEALWRSFFSPTTIKQTLGWFVLWIPCNSRHLCLPVLAISWASRSSLWRWWMTCSVSPGSRPARCSSAKCPHKHQRESHPYLNGCPLNCIIFYPNMLVGLGMSCMLKWKWKRCNKNPKGCAGEGAVGQILNLALLVACSCSTQQQYVDKTSHFHLWAKLLCSEVHWAPGPPYFHLKHRNT